jgi:hypothetical protein
MLLGQVGDLGLADWLGAEMPTSRWRVCWAMYTHLLTFVAALVVLVLDLERWGRFMQLLLVVVAATNWWWGVARDHEKDYQKQLDSSIQAVTAIVEEFDEFKSEVATCLDGEFSNRLEQFLSKLEKAKLVLCRMEVRQRHYQQRWFLHGSWARQG